MHTYMCSTVYSKVQVVLEVGTSILKTGGGGVEGQSEVVRMEFLIW